MIRTFSGRLIHVSHIVEFPNGFWLLVNSTVCSKRIGSHYESEIVHFPIFSLPLSGVIRIGLSSMKVTKLENLENKIGLTGCKWSSFNASISWFSLGLRDFKLPIFSLHPMDTNGESRRKSRFGFRRFEWNNRKSPWNRFPKSEFLLQPHNQTWRMILLQMECLSLPCSK